MKLGFTFKKAKKTGLLAPGPAQGDANGSSVSRAFEAAPVKKDDDAGKVYVTDFDPAAVAANATEKKATLVIPLLKANEWKAPAALLDDDAPVEASAVAETAVESESKPEMTEDEAAAAQLLADVQAQQNGDSGTKKANMTLVIPMKNGGKTTEEEEADPLAEKRAKLYNRKGEKKDTTAAVPILQQNAVPGMDELADVTEKFRHDVELRPDELDVHSAVYDSVPIEDFGAAMLRGMGWKGSIEEEAADADDPKPRQRLLGLGATAKPKVAGDNGKNDRRRSDNQPRSNGLNRREEKDDKKHRPSSSSGKDTSKKDDRRQRSADREKPRSRSRDRESRKDRDRDNARRSEKGSDDRRRDRDEDRSRDKGKERDRARSRSRERDSGRDHDRDRERGREGGRDRDRKDDREKRKRSRSRDRDRSSDRKRSSRR